MKFKLEVSVYETIFPNYQIYDMRDKGKIIFNLIDIEEDKFEIFCEAKNKEILLDEENSVICFRCVN